MSLIGKAWQNSPACWKVNKMSVDKNVPEIRFKGFSGEWDKKILGELVQLENGFAFQSKYFKKNPTEAIVLTPGSVNIGGGFQAGKGQYYDAKQDVSPKYVFKPDDIFITMTDLTPTAQALGFPAIIPRDNNTYLHNQRLGKLVGFKGDLGFLYNLFRTQKKQKEVVSTSSGTTVKHTSPDKFLNRFCLFPRIEEQTQIGNTFQKLDSLINQHQQKHDKLSSIKKAMLEKMFPKQGETIPEIRFKGFSGEWNESNLAECTDLLTGNPFNSKEFTSDGIFLVRGMNVKRGYLDASPKLSEYWSSSKGLECYLLEPEDIVVQMDGALIGNSYAKINSKNLPAILVQRVTRIRCAKVDPEFIYQYIQKDFLNHISGIKTETAVPHLSLHDIRNFSVFLPESYEQNAIGNYFQKLDRLINQHQQQITKLNNIKQACLSKMFV